MPGPNDVFINRMVASATAKMEIVDTSEEKPVMFSHVEMSFRPTPTTSSSTTKRPWGFRLCKTAQSTSASSHGGKNTPPSASTWMLPSMPNCTKHVRSWRCSTSNLTASACMPRCCYPWKSSDSAPDKSTAHTAPKSSPRCSSNSASAGHCSRRLSPANPRQACSTCFWAVARRATLPHSIACRFVLSSVAVAPPIIMQ